MTGTKKNDTDGREAAWKAYLSKTSTSERTAWSAFKAAYAAHDPRSLTRIERNEDGGVRFSFADGGSWVAGGPVLIEFLESSAAAAFRSSNGRSLPEDWDYACGVVRLLDDYDDITFKDVDRARRALRAVISWVQERVALPVDAAKPGDTMALAPRIEHFGLGHDCGCARCDWYRKHPQCRPEEHGGAPKKPPLHDVRDRVPGLRR